MARLSLGILPHNRQITLMVCGVNERESGAYTKRWTRGPGWRSTSKDSMLPVRSLSRGLSPRKPQTG